MWCVPAQRILQSKDQLISRLKEGGGGTDGDSGDLAQAELEQVRSERELAQTEVHKLAARVQQLRDELQHAETAALEEAQAAGEALRETEAREAAEARLRQELEKELEAAQQVRHETGRTTGRGGFRDCQSSEGVVSMLSCFSCAVDALGHCEIMRINV